MCNGDWCPRGCIVHMWPFNPSWRFAAQYVSGSLQFLDRLLHFGMWCINMTMRYWSSIDGWDEGNVVGCYSNTTLYYKVLQSTAPVLLCTTKYYSVLQSISGTHYSVLQRTTPVLLQYCPVLKRTTPVLLRTKNVLLQYYSVLQSTTPVQLCTTKYYSSTTLYYKVLLQYCSVLPALQLEEPAGAAISQGEVFLAVDLGCPSFEYLVTSFTTSFIPRSRPRTLPLQKACFQAAISKQFALNMIVGLKGWYLC